MIFASEKRSDRPDPEVPEKKPRRKFTAQYKLRILEKADACTRPGEMGALLRKEGLYSSILTTRKRQRDQGVLDAMSPQKKGRKKVEKNPLAQEVARLQKETERLRRNLKHAETIIDVQKNIGDAGDLPGSRRREQLMNTATASEP